MSIVITPLDFRVLPAVEPFCPRPDSALVSSRTGTAEVETKMDPRGNLPADQDRGCCVSIEYPRPQPS